MMSTECTVNRLLVEPMLSGNGVVFADRCHKMHGKPVVVAHLFFEHRTHGGRVYYLQKVSASFKAEIEDSVARILNRRYQMRTERAGRVNVPTFDDIHYLARFYPELI